MKKCIVLITNEPNDGWARELASILHSIGRFIILALQDFSANKLPAGCALVIVDATAVDSFSTVVTKVRQFNPQQRVIVMTASPNWQLAREAFAAGAMDYLSKNQPNTEILKNIRAVLEKKVSPSVPVEAATQ